MTIQDHGLNSRRLLFRETRPMIDNALLDRGSAIEQMNSFGRCGEAFFFLINFEGDQGIVKPLNEAASLGVFFDFQNEKQKTHYSQGLTIQKNPLDFSSFEKKVESIIEEIGLGNSYLTNLTFKTPIESEASLEEIYYHSNARYKLLVKDEFVVFSPETFVRIHENEIQSNPMKGTIEAAIPNAREIILNDAKETAEHVTIVDLIRNDLSKVADNVTVERFRYIEELSTNHKDLLQVSSEIKGKLADNWSEHLGDILFDLLPAGSISGAPKEKTIDIIRQVEGEPRGFYTGVFGVFDGSNLDSCVLIRFIEQCEGKLFYRSGGGITFKSDPQLEYQEMLNKIYVPVH